MRQMHDLGGVPIDEPIDRDDHERNLFEQRVDALVRLLGHPSRRVVRTDELRRGIESLSPQQYATYSYYERWLHSVKLLVVEKQVLSEAEIAAKVEAIRARLAATPQDYEPPPPPAGGL